VLAVIFILSEFKEQHMFFKFCFKLGGTATEIYSMLKVAFGDETVSRTQTFEWFWKIRSGMNSVDAEHLAFIHK
jgi:hypothetical protein